MKYFLFLLQENLIDPFIGLLNFTKNYFLNLELTITNLANTSREAGWGLNEALSNIYNYLINALIFLASLNIIKILLILLPILISVAFMTIIERKQLAAMQRRVGPNTVGIYGVLQPFADALKLILKENIIPAQSNKIIFYLAPVSSLLCSLLAWGIIPFGPGISISDFSMGILYTLALSSLGVYGILFAG